LSEFCVNPSKNQAKASANRGSKINLSAVQRNPSTANLVITIEVTQEDINNGERKDGCKCPVALAFQRAGARGAFSVGYFYVYPKGLTASDSETVSDKIRIARSLPEEVTQFNHDFDDGKPVTPFSFEWNPQG
jgi:hypothetical protein